MAGGFVEKQLRLDLTYDEIDNTIDNLWSVLFTTGYLTKIGEVKVPDSESYAYKLVIPNKEVREVFILQIQEWFKSVVANDDDTMKLLSKAILDKDEKQITRQLNIVMSRMISILDTKAPDAMKENFYHGLLLGLLRGSNPDWLIKSNRESGDGFSDILIEPEDPDAGIVIEVKYAKEMKELDAACETAMAQIKNKRYDNVYEDEDFKKMFSKVEDIRNATKIKWPEVNPDNQYVAIYDYKELIAYGVFDIDCDTYHNYGLKAGCKSTKIYKGYVQDGHYHGMGIEYYSNCSKKNEGFWVAGDLKAGVQHNSVVKCTQGSLEWNEDEGDFDGSPDCELELLYQINEDTFDGGLYMLEHDIVESGIDNYYVADYKFAGNKRGLFTKMVSLDVFSQRLLSEGSGSYKRIARLLQQLEYPNPKVQKITWQ